MTAEPRPVLGLTPPTVSQRPAQIARDAPRPSRLGPSRQGERIAPQFKALTEAFDAQRAAMGTQLPDETDPGLVVVFDLVGSVEAFGNAIQRIEGLEFLSEALGDFQDPDDDFYMADSAGKQADKSVPHSLYLVMSNSKAIDELIRLFEDWKASPNAKFAHGIGKFRSAFEQLSAIRRWGAEDRVRETGLRERWQETVAVVGQSVTSVLVEVELWHRQDAEARAAAQAHVEGVVASSGGSVLTSSHIEDIGYHALLVDLPIQQVESVLANGAGAIQLLTTDEIMFVGPFEPMSVTFEDLPAASDYEPLDGAAASGEPRIALFDGLPLQNHDALTGRLIVDDPDDIGQDYPAAVRAHGTAMASLIIHGDLSEGTAAIDRPLYVRPIMQPHPFVSTCEQVLPEHLLPDLLHRAVVRLFEGANPAAPSVRVINLSIGSATRALARRMSAAGRLLDWLAHTYNVLFIVSAGNHLRTITIPAAAAAAADTAGAAALVAVYGDSLLRGVLPPGDALNAVTVGATHEDSLGDVDLPDTVWDVTRSRARALYSATGPGVFRSIKPDIHFSGGRAVYVRPVVDQHADSVGLDIAPATIGGPGLRVAAPATDGSTNRTRFSIGTSNATALVTRAASQVFDILELDMRDSSDPPLPDPEFHPLVTRAMLAHASEWGSWGAELRADLELDSTSARRKLSALLGYGRLDLARLCVAATNRAVVAAGGRLRRDERHTYELPLPPSLRARAEWHRFTITLAYHAPTTARLSRYRAAKLHFDTPNLGLAAGSRVGAEHRMVRRGSLQHEIVEGTQAMVFGAGAVFPVHIDCMDDAMRLKAGESIRYALVVSVETSEEVSTTIHDEVRQLLRVAVAERARTRI